MNINNLGNTVPNTVINSANSRPADAVQNTDAQKATEVAQNTDTATNTSNATQSDNVKLSGHDTVNALLKELATRFSLSQKTFENMPESLKNEIKQLLSQKASLFDLSGGLAHVVQGQKDVFGNLNKLAETLSNLAKFLAEADQAGDEQQQMPQSTKDFPLTKDAVMEKMNAQLLKQLLDSITTKETQLTDGKTTDSKQPANPKEADQAQNLKDAVRQQAAQTVINKNTAGTTLPNQPDTQKEVVELLKNLYQELSTASDRQNQAAQESSKNQQQFTKEDANAAKEQTGKNQMVRQDNTNFFKDVTVVKGLAEALGKENLNQLLSNLKEMAERANQLEQNPKNQEAQKDAATTPQNRPNVEGNSLLQQAKQILPETQPATTITPQQVAELMKNMRTFSSLLQQSTLENPQLLKALQTLTNNPAMLSNEEKTILHAVMAQLIKDVFKGKDELGVLEKALNRLATKDKMFLDKETTDLQTFNKLLKNADSLQYSRQQVDRWANALRELAGSMAKSSGFVADRGSNHIHSSFVFNLATDGQDKNNPVYINVYHEKDDNVPGGKAPETWLRVKVQPEYMGEVTAIFHLYQDNLLDVKIIFSNNEAMDEFSRFVPNIEEALKNTNMQLNSIMVV